MQEKHYVQFIGNEQGVIRRMIEHKRLLSMGMYINVRVFRAQSNLEVVHKTYGNEQNLALMETLLSNEKKTRCINQLGQPQGSNKSCTYITGYFIHISGTFTFVSLSNGEP